jgi:hypothetical protein
MLVPWLPPRDYYVLKINKLCGLFTGRTRICTRTKNSIHTPISDVLRRTSWDHLGHCGNGLVVSSKEQSPVWKRALACSRKPRIPRELIGGALATFEDLPSSMSASAIWSQPRTPRPENTPLV